MDTEEQRGTPTSGRDERSIEEWIPIRDAAERLGISEESILRWCESGAIPWRLTSKYDEESSLVEWDALRHHHESLSGEKPGGMPEWVEQLVETWKRSAETEEEMRFLGRQVGEIQRIFEEHKRQADELHLAMRRESDRAASPSGPRGARRSEGRRPYRRTIRRDVAPRGCGQGRRYRRPFREGSSRRSAGVARGAADGGRERAPRTFRCRPDRARVRAQGSRSRGLHHGRHERARS